MKFHKSFRSTHWSNAKVISWLIPQRPNFTLKTSEDFKAFENYLDNIPKIERVIDKLQDIIMFPVDLVHSIRIHFRNCKGNTHVLDGGLDKGSWYDLDYRISHCLFGELEKFIEQEKGLEIHQWEQTLIFNEDYRVYPEDDNYGKLTPQALNAIEQNEIYNWWKDNKIIKESQLENHIKEEEDMLIRLIKIRHSLWT